MAPEKILEQHDQVSGLAQKHLRTLLTELQAQLLSDGWTADGGIERDLDELFSSSGACTTYGLGVTASGHDNETLTVYAGFSSGYEPVTGMFFHDFGLKLVNAEDDVLFETPLQTWQGAWSPAQLEAMLAEALSREAACRFYEDMAARLTM